MTKNLTRNDVVSVKQPVPPVVREELNAEISLRDYFASMAMSGIISRPDGVSTIADVARYAYSIADGMIRQRKRQE